MSQEPLQEPLQEPSEKSLQEPSPSSPPASPQAASAAATPSPAVPPTAQPTAQPTTPKRPPAPRSKPQALLQMLGQIGGIVLAMIPALWSLLRQGLELIWSLLQWLNRQWQLLLPKVKALLPDSLRNLPDLAITATAIALLILLFWVPRVLFSPRSTAIAQDAPPSQVAPTATVDSPPIPQPVRSRPNPNARRIAALQKQLTTVTDTYTEGLIQSVQTNFDKHRLQVSVTTGWNGLSLTQQEQLANELLKRSKALKFTELELIDSEGEVLARSPVVGKGMVLLHGS